jgi:trimethylamine--corrinoid protein Co-methyltransferase
LYTTAGFQVHQNIHWEMLTDDQCETIVATSIELLERTGVDVESEAAREAFKAAGCFVEGNRVRIPSAKSEWALRTAPSRVTLCDRNGKRAMLLEMGQAHYGPGYTPQQCFDQATGEVRDFGIADVETYGKLCQMLPNIDFAMSGGFPVDVAAENAEIESFKALVGATTKPILQNVKNVRQAKAIVEMAAAVKGRKNRRFASLPQNTSAGAFRPRMRAMLKPMAGTMCPAGVVRMSGSAELTSLSSAGYTASQFRIVT